MSGEGRALATDVTKSACQRRVFCKAESPSRVPCPLRHSKNRNFSLQTTLLESLLETRSKTNHYLLLVRFENALRCTWVLGWEWQTMEIRPMAQFHGGLSFASANYREAFPVYTIRVKGPPSPDLRFYFPNSPCVSRAEGLGRQ